MLTDEQIYTLTLIRKSMGLSCECHVNNELDMIRIAKDILRNGILTTVYTSIDDFSQLKAYLKNDYYASISQNVNQAHDCEIVLKALGLAGLKCMAFKGWQTKDYYPNIVMRQMTDIDILVYNYNYINVQNVMTNLGYNQISWESSEKHDVYGRDYVTFEIHKRLTDDSGHIREWEAQMWNHVVPIYDNVYQMSAEDHYIYHFVHMMNDFINGWFGLRRVIDVWLLDRQSEDLDFEYITHQFTLMGINSFWEHMQSLSRVCMGELPMDDDTELLLTYAFECGIYGNSISHKTSRITNMSHGSLVVGKVRSILAAVFLPYSRMKAHYPILEKVPILLPFCWIERIFGNLTNGDLGKYRRMLDYSDVTVEDLEYTRRVLRAGGC